MLSAVLVLALAFDQKVTVRVGEKPDSVQSQQKATSDTIDENKSKRRERKRIPVTPELEASAFKDQAARSEALWLASDACRGIPVLERFLPEETAAPYATVRHVFVDRQDGA